MLLLLDERVIIIATAVYLNILDHQGKILFCFISDSCFGEITLISLIRASPGTVLKGFPPVVIEEQDKVHILLMMEALGKYKEAV